MSDTTPLIPQSHSVTTKIPPPPSLNDAIERHIGDFSWAQFIQALLVSLSWVFDAQQTFITVFTDAQPTWHCNDGNSSCTSASDICKLSDHSWSYDMPIHTSIISEWGLHCSTSLVQGLPASSFFMGCLVGGLLLASLADTSLGRKNMLFFSCLLMSVSSLLTVFSKNIWIYSLLRFVNGFGRASIQTSAIVLTSEVVGKKWRAQVGTMGFFTFTIGFLSLPALAYINEGYSWRNLYLWTSVPTIFYCIVVRLFVRESPRWLLVQGRKEEAVTIIKSIAPTSHTNTDNIITKNSNEYSNDEDDDDDDIQQICRLPSMMSFSNVTMEQGTPNVSIYSAIKILVEKRWALRRLTATMLAGFGIGMVYYGMPLGVGNLSFNLYWSVVFNALAELPAALFTLLFIGKLNRKGTLMVLTAVSGVASIMCVVVGKVWPRVQIGLELFSFCGATTAFNFLVMYTVELFPTCIRNSALSIERQALVFGGVFSPVLVAAGRENGYLSYGVFGLVIGISGIYLIGLPETNGKTLCDTMDEEEYKDKAGSNVGREFVH